MSLAKKCDLCGNLYEDYTINVEDNAVNAFVLVCTDDEDRWSNVKEAIDCCPQCMRSIVRHIRSLQPKVYKPEEREEE